MTPQNTAERKSSFLYFLIFFIITVTLILLAVFFGMQVPFKENDAMKDQVAAMQKNRDFMQNFTTKMSDTQSLLDSLNKPGAADPLIIDQQIASDLNSLMSMENSDSSHLGIYNNIEKNLQDLWDAKKQLRGDADKDGQILKLKSDYSSLLDKYNSLASLPGK